MYWFEYMVLDIAMKVHHLKIPNIKFHNYAVHDYNASQLFKC